MGAVNLPASLPSIADARLSANYEAAKPVDVSSVTIPIADVVIRDRHRKEMGDLNNLATAIRDQGLLQPIGITEGKVLVFGERRLRACRDILDWTEIAARIVHVTSIVEGEFTENEMRKDWTVSERVAIAATVKAEIGNRQGERSDLAARAAKLSGRTDDE